MKTVALILAGLAVSPAFAWDGGLRMPSGAEISAVVVPAAAKGKAGSELTVTVTGFKSSGASAILSICDSAACHKQQDAGYKDIPAALISSGGASRTYKITGLKPGEYSLTAYHDENGNGKLDTGMFGIPEEPVGFSMLNVKKLSSHPRWESVKFSVAEGSSKVTVYLVHEFGL